MGNQTGMGEEDRISRRKIVTSIILFADIYTLIKEKAKNKIFDFFFAKNITKYSKKLHMKIFK